MKNLHIFLLLAFNILIIYLIMRYFNIKLNSMALFIASIANAVLYIIEVYTIVMFLKRADYDKNN